MTIDLSCIYTISKVLKIYNILIYIYIRRHSYANFANRKDAYTGGIRNDRTGKNDIPLPKYTENTFGHG